MDVYGDGSDPRLWQVLVAGSLAGATLTQRKPGADSKEFRDKVAIGTACGLVRGSDAVAKLVSRLAPERNICGGSVFEQAQVDQWVDFNNLELRPPCLAVSAALTGATHSAVLADVQKAVNVLEDHLECRTYMVGEALTLADIALACTLAPILPAFSPQSPGWNFTYTRRWLDTCLHQPCFQVLPPYQVVEVKEAPAQRSAQSKPAKSKPAKSESGKKKSFNVSHLESMDDGKNFVQVMKADLPGFMESFPPKSDGPVQVWVWDRKQHYQRGMYRVPITSGKLPVGNLTKWLNKRMSFLPWFKTLNKLVALPDPAQAAAGAAMFDLTAGDTISTAGDGVFQSQGKPFTGIVCIASG